MDYSFKEKADVKLITLFIIENFKMPVPNYYIVDTLTLEQFINYFDLQQEIGELEEDELITYYIEDDTTVFERAPLARLAAEGQLKSYKHEGFWQCMDTKREMELLEKLLATGNAPWKKWED